MPGKFEVVIRKTEKMKYLFIGSDKEECKKIAEKSNIDIEIFELEPAKWLGPNKKQKVAREIKKIDETVREYYELLLVWFPDIWTGTENED